MFQFQFLVQNRGHKCFLFPTSMILDIGDELSQPSRIFVFDVFYIKKLEITVLNVYRYNTYISNTNKSLYSNSILCYKIYENFPKEIVLYLHKTIYLLLSGSTVWIEIIFHTGLVCVSATYYKYLSLHARYQWYKINSQKQKQNYTSICSFSCLLGSLYLQWLFSCH